ncbi:TLC domain-containing protein 2-like [Mytilus galloprovincialis]|uniref:TLC domain-containing protein 2-like n=1 Tax=Mytilus galloprovincialis TaxID=29158 RepID=UPI003F7BDE81
MTDTEIWPEKFDGAVYGLTVVITSSFLFYVLGRIAHVLTPASACHSPWRWKNISVSLVHAVIVGTWACLSFYETPKMAEDMIKTYSNSAHTLISFSFGYFVYDMWDMLIYQRNRHSFELMGHHVVIFICFGIAIVTKLYIGYAVVALVIEINSIFLHIRQLLQICRYSKNNSAYRLNSLINLGTFVVCRITVMAWMSRWLLINKDLVPLIFYSIGSVGLAVMTVMNIILFYRLLQSDFIKKNESKKENSH